MPLLNYREKMAVALEMAPRFTSFEGQDGPLTQITIKCYKTKQQ